VRRVLSLAGDDWKGSAGVQEQILGAFREVEDRSDELMVLISGLADEKQQVAKPVGTVPVPIGRP
jgi:hypothetical protein